MSTALAELQNGISKLNAKGTTSKATDATGLCGTWAKVKPYLNLLIVSGILGAEATKQLKILRTALNAECKV